MGETRKIAAILAADVVGFSRLAGADEDRTLARLRALRSDLIDPTIAVHNGRVVKRTGDGALVEFRSVVDAVRCDVEIQNAMVERNAGVPQDRRIEFRVGIHLGDVVEESDGDLMGDGVNIAAQLEGVAQPGAICLYVLEGGVRKAGNRLRITAQLIEAESGSHLWADRFDGALDDVFDLQDQITDKVVGVVEPSLQRSEIERSRRKRPESLDAYDLYLRALPHIGPLAPADARIAAGLLRGRAEA